MRVLLTLTRREIAAHFLSPLSYVVLFFVFLLSGFFVSWALLAAGGDIRSTVYQFVDFASFTSVFAGPVLTMRLIAEERRLGTLELLVTAPVRDVEIVLAKFAGALVFYVTLWLALPVYVLHFAALGGRPDWGQIASMALGLLTLGATYLSVGLFASALSSSQVVAMFAGIVLNLLLLLGPQLLTQIGDWDVLHYANFSTHLADFAKGVVDGRHVVFHGSLVAVFLFFTVRLLEVRKWK